MLVHSISATAFVFVSTNLDDMVVVATFFATPGMRRGAVVAGQLLGLGGIIALSVLAAYLMLPVPPGWISLLGVIPLLLGSSKLWRLVVSKHRPDACADREKSWTQQQGGTFLGQVVMVTLVTVANGGDNLSAYIPLFAKDVSVIPAYVATLLPFTVLWCLLGYGLVRNPSGVALISRWGHVILPLVLIAVGFHVLWGAQRLFGA